MNATNKGRAQNSRQEDSALLSILDESILSLRSSDSINAADASLLDGFPAVGTVEDVAIYLKIRPAQVRDFCRSGVLRAIKCGNLWRIPKGWLAEFIDEGGTNGR